jgi:hypothetical protein
MFLVVMLAFSDRQYQLPSTPSLGSSSFLSGDSLSPLCRFAGESWVGQSHAIVCELMSQAARSAWVNVLRLTSDEWRASREGRNIVVYASPSQHWVTHRNPRSLRSLARIKPLQSWSGRSQYVGYAIFAAARCLKRVSQLIPAKKGDKICQPGSGAECNEEARSVSVMCNNLRNVFSNRLVHPQPVCRDQPGYLKSMLCRAMG